MGVAFLGGRKPRLCSWPVLYNWLAFGSFVEVWHDLDQEPWNHSLAQGFLCAAPVAAQLYSLWDEMGFPNSLIVRYPPVGSCVPGSLVLLTRGRQPGPVEGTEVGVREAQGLKIVKSGGFQEETLHGS